MKRKHISKKLRFSILERDGFRCVYCGAADKELHLDHVVPFSKGGDCSVENLVSSCFDCNIGKMDEHIEITSEIKEKLSKLVGDQLTSNEQKLINAIRSEMKLQSSDWPVISTNQIRKKYKVHPDYFADSLASLLDKGLIDRKEAKYSQNIKTFKYRLLKDQCLKKVSVLDGLQKTIYEFLTSKKQSQVLVKTKEIRDIVKRSNNQIANTFQRLQEKGLIEVLGYSNRGYRVIKVIT